MKSALHKFKIKKDIFWKEVQVECYDMNNKQNIKNCSENQIKILIVRKELDSSCKPRKSEINFNQLPGF